MHDALDLLIAEDDADDLMLLTRAIRQVAPELSIASVQDGVALGEFLERCSVAPRVVLLDLNMPRLDGRAFLAQWHSHDQTRDLPAFIVLTTSAEAPDRARALREGASGFLIKPPSFSELTAMVRALVSRWLPDRLTQ